MTLHRTQGLLEKSVLSSKKLIFVGLGSLGSLVLANLAYHWKEIVLIDPDHLRQENIERHILGKSCIGKLKVEGLKNWLNDRGVEQVTALGKKVQDVLLEQTGANLVIVCTGQGSAESFVNSWSFEAKVPVMYAGVYPKGSGGEVIVIPDSEKVCYLCARAFLGTPSIVPDGYGYIGPFATMNAVPALRWAISAVAADCADLALEYLKGGEAQAQVLVHAHNWQPLIWLGEEGEAQRTVAAFVSSQPNLGLVPHLRLGKSEEYQLQAQRSIFSFVLPRWSGCPLHLGLNRKE